jgi:sarcosine oxidase, subunit beta
MGMDIIQQCEVKGSGRKGGKVTGVETTKGFIGCKKLGIVVAGHSGQVADMAGFRLPVEAWRCRRWCPSRSSPAWTSW